MYTIHIFYEDEELRKELQGIVGSTVKLYKLNFKDLVLYNSLKQAVLPNNRNPIKDTIEYLILMNSKVEFLKRAKDIDLDPLSSSSYIWLDAGILKIIKNQEILKTCIKHLNNVELNTILIPGIHNRQDTIDLNRVYWRFCGGILVIPKEYIDRFYTNCIQTCNLIKTNYNLATWEVNVWALIEDNVHIQWIQCIDHDDSMFNCLIY